MAIHLFGAVTTEAKSYQVTGPVLEVAATRIVVQKGDEKWEIARNPQTKVTGDLKVGAKVTIYYTWWPMGGSEGRQREVSPVRPPVLGPKR
jgi:hypothetical protein